MTFTPFIVAVVNVVVVVALVNITNAVARAVYARTGTADVVRVVLCVATAAVGVV